MLLSFSDVCLKVWTPYIVLVGNIPVVPILSGMFIDLPPPPPPPPPEQDVKW